MERIYGNIEGIIDMLRREDNTYNEMVKKSVLQWLEEQAECDDMVSKHGAKLTIEHIQQLNNKIKELEGKIALRDEFLKKLKSKIRELE